MSNQERLNLILKKANIPDDLMKPWQGAFKFLMVKDINLLVAVFKQLSPQEVLEYSYMLKDKIIALKAGDTKWWQEIIEQEINSLS